MLYCIAGLQQSNWIHNPCKTKRIRECFACFKSSRGVSIAEWVFRTSIRVRFGRPCPEDDVQCGQHGSSGFLWASVCLHCGGKVHQWCYLRVRVLGWLVVEFRVEQSQQQNPRYWNIANVANIAQKVTKTKGIHRFELYQDDLACFFLQELSRFTREIYEVRQEAEGRMAVLECQWYLAHGLRSEQSSMFPSLRKNINFEEGHINKTHQSKVFIKDSSFLFLVPS